MSDAGKWWVCFRCNSRGPGAVGTAHECRAPSLFQEKPWPIVVKDAAIADALEYTARTKAELLERLENLADGCVMDGRMQVRVGELIAWVKEEML